MRRRKSGRAPQRAFDDSWRFSEIRGNSMRVEVNRCTPANLAVTLRASTGLGADSVHFDKPMGQFDAYFPDSHSIYISGESGRDAGQLWEFHAPGSTSFLTRHFPDVQRVCTSFTLLLTMWRRPRWNLSFPNQSPIPREGSRNTEDDEDAGVELDAHQGVRDLLIVSL